MSKAVYDTPTPAQQKIVMAVGAGLAKFALEEAIKDDERVAKVYTNAGVKVVVMDEAAFKQWRKIAEDTAFKDFAEKVPNGKRLLEMALEVK